MSSNFLRASTLLRKKFLPSFSSSILSNPTILRSKTSSRYFSTEIKWPISRVRSQFIKYFEENHDHTFVPSSPVVPSIEDATLLFTNAGMNQFKSLFLNTCSPSSPFFNLKRAVNSQKCIRAGGKHNDLDDVGKDTYHHTFFEMLGTWSFNNNYGKEEAISMAYDLLVNVYGLDPNRLYVSYFAGDKEMNIEEDLETKEIWSKFLPKNRILPFKKKENFWEMGEIGPCGPCTEIHYDRIGGRFVPELVNADDPMVIEIWNLVFITHSRELATQSLIDNYKEGESDYSLLHGNPTTILKKLANSHVDTGMGLERLTSILQEVHSNYDIDGFSKILNEIHKEIGGEKYTGLIGKEDIEKSYRDTSYRVLADHLRTLAIALADGVFPSNDGRGYVIRRILRRAVRYSYKLKAKPGCLSRLISTIIDEYGETYKELLINKENIINIIREEEINFFYLVEKGEKKFLSIVEETKKKDINNDVISGKDAFFLYDTMGFPIDLTVLMAEEKNMKVDQVSFNEEMLKQKERSRQAQSLLKLNKFSSEDTENTSFSTLILDPNHIAELKSNNVSYTNDSYKYLSKDLNGELNSKILSFFNNNNELKNEINIKKNETFGLILESTNLYAEAGGQIADYGDISIKSGDQEIVLNVLDVQNYGGYVLHTCVLQNDNENNNEIILNTNQDAKIQLNQEKRNKITPNHTTTHLLNYILKSIFGNIINQKGSLVNESKLRFDFSYTKALTLNELEQIEEKVNQEINSKKQIYHRLLPLKDALLLPNIRYLVGEDYPDPVRVLSVGVDPEDLLKKKKNGEIDEEKEKEFNFSIEFCGGTHIDNTIDAEHFCILEESAVSKGIRRITGVTGSAARTCSLRSELYMNDLLNFENETKNSLFSSNNNELNEQEVEKKLLLINEFEKKINTFKQRSNQEELSQFTRIKSRQQLDKIIKDLIDIKKNLIQQKVEKIVQNELKQISKNNNERIFLSLSIDNDSKILKKALELIQKVSSFLFLFHLIYFF